MRRTLLALTLTLTAVPAIAADAALAKGQVDRVVIRGPGIAGPVSLTEPALLRALAMGGLEDIASASGLISAPRVGAGYELTRYAHGRLPGDVAFARVRYYPPRGGGPGYVFHDNTTGSARANWYDGRWFVATPNGDRAMRRVLARYAVRAKPAEATSGIGWPFLAIGAVALAAGLAARWRPGRLRVG